VKLTHEEFSFAALHQRFSVSTAAPFKGERDAAQLM
jgi:hypothetical protein